MTAILRRQTWSSMTTADREALCHRGLDDIFDSGLRSSIGELIEDVRLRGDQAVCDALQKFDGITLTPSQLQVSAQEIADARIDPAIENAIVDAISHLRAFNEGTNGCAKARVEDVVKAAVTEGFLVGISHGCPCLAAKDCGHIKKSTRRRGKGADEFRLYQVELIHVPKEERV